MNYQMFDDLDYETLHELVFQPDYPGYKPAVVEIPNGDGMRDETKKYAHVALKYFQTSRQARNLLPFLTDAHDVAVRAAKAAGFPEHLLPDLRYGALRVLDYPPGALSNLHRDFDLFTIMCYRDQPDKFVAHDSDASSPIVGPAGNRVGTMSFGTRVITEIRKYDPQAHLGEIAEVELFGAATPHEVLASDTRQRSIVYFAIPDHDAVLRTGETVRDWLNNRVARSRTEFKKYE